MDLNFDLSNDIIVAPRGYHEELLLHLRQNPLHNFKLVTKEEVIETFKGEYSFKAIIMIMNKYHKSYENAMELLKYVQFAEKFFNDKTRLLWEINEYLKEQNALVISPYKKMQFAHKSIAIVGYGSSDKELEGVLQGVADEIKFIPYVQGRYLPEVQKYSNVNEELYSVFNQICHLISQGVNQEDIVIIANTDKYYLAMNKMCESFDLPHFIPSTLNYAQMPHTMALLSEIQEIGFEDFLLNHELDEDEDVQTIVELIKKYELNFIEGVKNQYSTLKSLLKKITIKENLPLVIKTYSQLPLVADQKHYFLLGFNLQEYPRIKQDEGYLNNKDLAALGCNTTLVQNKTMKEQVIDFITHAPNIHISFPLNRSGESLYPSSLIKELSLKVTEGECFDIYKNKESIKLLGTYLDLKRKFNLISPMLKNYQAQFEIPYRGYEHHFTPINYQAPLKRRYSYSKIKTFFQCQFRYYLTNVLGLDDFEDTFSKRLGLLYHEVLTKVYDDNFDFNQEYQSVLENYTFNLEEKVILDAHFDDFKFLCNHLRAQRDFMKLKKVYHEFPLEIALSDEVTIKGQIDKIIVTSDGIKDYYAIIDYKTGSESFKQDEIIHGFSMQLPTYALLTNNSAYFQDKELIGLYIENIFANKIGVAGEDLDSFYRDAYKLKGVSSNDIEKMETFDATCRDSLFIKSYKLTKDNQFNRYAKISDFDGFKKMMKIAKDNFLKADEQICQGDFRINPKIVGKNTESECKYCPFKDICGVEDDDYEHLELQGDDE